MSKSKISQKLTLVSERITRKAPIVILLFVISYLAVSTLIIPNLTAFNSLHLLSTIRSNEREIDVSMQDSMNILLVVTGQEGIENNYLINVQSSVNIIQLPLVVDYAKYQESLESSNLGNLQVDIESQLNIYIDRIIIFQRSDISSLQSLTNSNDIESLLVSTHNNSLFFNFNQIASKLSKSMISNFSNNEFVSLIAKLRDAAKFDEIDLSTAVIGDNLTARLARYLIAPSITKEQARIEVSNASQMVGKAGNAALKLENMGYFISKVGNFDIVTDKDLILVKDRDKYAKTLSSLEKIFPEAEIKYQGIESLSIADILVILGKK